MSPPRRCWAWRFSFARRWRTSATRGARSSLGLLALAAPGVAVDRRPQNLAGARKPGLPIIARRLPLAEWQRSRSWAMYALAFLAAARAIGITWQPAISPSASSRRSCSISLVFMALFAAFAAVMVLARAVGRGGRSGLVGALEYLGLVVLLAASVTLVDRRGWSARRSPLPAAPRGSRRRRSALRSPLTWAGVARCARQTGRWRLARLDALDPDSLALFAGSVVGRGRRIAALVGPRGAAIRGLRQAAASRSSTGTF